MQEDKTLQQQIREYESNMPPEILNLIKSFDWKKEVRTIVNQNQLMIDVGSELEDGIYLMLLGALEARDLHDQLTEGYQIPEDKVRKILEEVETLIFSPLYKKLMDLDKKQQTNPIKKDAKDLDSRDNILAEIEKEPEPVILLRFDQTEQTPTTTSPQTPIDKGVTKPFTIATTQAVKTQEPMLAQGTVAQGVQQDPINAGLTGATVTQTPAPVKTPTIDPYREPIE